MNFDGKAEYFLGIEAGGTRSTVVAVGGDLRVLHRQEFGPANLKLLSDKELAHHFSIIAAEFPEPKGVGIGIAGARDAADRSRVVHALEAAWGKVPVRVGHDLGIALAAVDSGKMKFEARVVVLSGTGSCCYGENSAGESAKTGGWGHLIGDKGSGYDIALSGLKAAVYGYDRHGRWGYLGENLLRVLLLTRPNDLIEWVQKADKREVAALAPMVFEAAERKDKDAAKILTAMADTLAQDALLCAGRLARKGQPVLFVLAGSVLLKQPAFARQISKRIQAAWKGAKVVPLQTEGAIGAAKWALQAGQPNSISGGRNGSGERRTNYYVPEFSPNSSPTELRNPRTTELDKLSIAEAVELMLSEEAIVVPSLLWGKDKIVQAVKLVSDAARKGGRIFYVGAGTSGRLGVLDASECPPTFRADPETFQGIVAGGQTALWQAVEGAEDDPAAGAQAVAFRGVRKGDVVVGIAASGRTPFVWGALDMAREKGAKTILICFNPSLKIDPKQKPNVVIAPDLGPEVLTGSTRLKAGTATKLILNTISTITMVRLGKVVSNLMIDLNPSNVKLRDRAVRIVQELTGADSEMATSALEKTGWVVKEARNALDRRKPARK